MIININCLFRNTVLRCKIFLYVCLTNILSWAKLWTQNIQNWTGLIFFLYFEFDEVVILVELKSRRSLHVFFSCFCFLNLYPELSIQDILSSIIFSDHLGWRITITFLKCPFLFFFYMLCFYLVLNDDDFDVYID